MTSERQYIIPSQHYGSALPVSEGEAGRKALGLFNLPASWVPPFFVLTVSGTETLLQAEGTSSTGRLASMVNTEPIGKILDSFRQISDRMLIRPSLVGGNTSERFHLVTQESGHTVAGIEDAIIRSRTIRTPVSTDLARDTDDEPRMAFIVQPKLPTQASGTVSNERRVSRRHDSWLVEEIDPQGELIRSYPISPGSALPETGQPLPCPATASIKHALRTLITPKFNHRGRRRYEWIWDGRTLWVVQCDYEVILDGQGPRRPADNDSAWTQSGAPIGPLRCFVPAIEASPKWHKIECLRTFRTCGLPTHSPLVLDDPEYLKQLASGYRPPALLEDIEHLLEFPVVVGTDIANSRQSACRMLLPRTDTLTRPVQMVEFLEATSAAFLTEGLSVESFCFLVHRLVPAVACSQSFARPGRKRVRVDSTWGVPDSLLYFPHDTFVFDVEAGMVKGRTIRCKTAYLDLTANGTWRQTRAGTPWDWRQSIGKEDLAVIAGHATALADRLGSPIQLLHLIGAPAATGFPRCLPWVYNTVDFDFGHIHHAARLSSATHVIHCPVDLQQLAIHFDRGSAAPAPLRLLPDAHYLRSVTFLKEVARFARRWDVPIDLQGSTLCAPHCLLKESGVRVRSLLSPSREDPDVKAFGKLVRDRIPDIVERKGDRAIVQKIPPQNWLGLLKTKIVEEAFEVQGAGKRDDILEEAADVLEVLRAISEALGESLEHLRVRADHKRSTRGGFDSGYVLKGTYAPPLNEPAAEGHLFPIDGSGIPERRFDLIWRPHIESTNLSGGKTLRLHLSTRRSPSPVEVLQPLKVIGLEGQLRIRQALGEVIVEIGPEPGRDLILGQLHLLE